jgi:hypothetical protein
MVKSPGQQVAAAVAVMAGTAIGVLTAGLGLALLASPWELHFAARHVATLVMVVVGFSVVAIGAVMVIDLVPGGPRLHTPRRRNHPMRSPSQWRVTKVSFGGDEGHGNRPGVGRFCGRR